MKLTFLGTGTSSGNPSLGCDCEVCTSKDPRDHRLRTSALLETRDHKRILFDCGPDFRQQMLRWTDTQPQNSPTRNFLTQVPQPGQRLPRVIHVVLITHVHYDHISGLDDLRPYSIGTPLPIYCAESVARVIRERLPYSFSEPPAHTFVPRFELHPIELHRPFYVEGLEVMPVQLLHGTVETFGYRIGRFAYLTDLHELPESEFEYLQGLDTIVIDALHRYKSHPTHESVPEALRLIERLQPRQAFLVHMSHRAGLHALTPQFLPSNVQYAYDTLTIELPD